MCKVEHWLFWSWRILYHFDQFGRPCCYMLPKFWIRHMGEMTVTYIFFRQIFTIFLRFLKPFLRLLFMVSALGQNDRYKLQPLHFGVFGAAVTRYCRIDWNAVTVTFDNVTWCVRGGVEEELVRFRHRGPLQRTYHQNHSSPTDLMNPLAIFADTGIPCPLLHIRIRSADLSRRNLLHW